MAKMTPMMAQYMEIKNEHKDCILMFRLGDFYEMFLEDAVEASKILQITLTSRNKNNSNDKMCGIPFHALDSCLSKLTRAGKKVAISDQITKPDGKGIVKRAVTRVVTPGTTFDDAILDNKSNNYISSLVKNGEEYGWQAKYFTNKLEDSQWQQLSDSFKTAFAKRYVRCRNRRENARRPRNTRCSGNFNSRAINRSLQSGR